MKIVICSSITFYETYRELKDKIEAFGHEVYLPSPKLEIPIEESGRKIALRTYINANGGIENFPYDHPIWEHKTKLMKAHFDQIENSDAILVTNYTKDDKENYIGGNTFLEIGYAFARGKRIFLLNPIPSVSYREEILGMRPIILHGNLNRLNERKL